MAARLPDKPKDYSGYARFFSHTSLMKKLGRTASKAGRTVMYAALGSADDLGALMWALKSIADNITPEICTKAAERLTQWFPDDGENPPELPMLNNEDESDETELF